MHPVPDRVKPSFVIFDIWALWRSGLSVRVPRCQSWASECPDVKNYKWRLNPVWHRMHYSCTRMATVGFKELICLILTWGVKLLSSCYQRSPDRKCLKRVNSSVLAAYLLHECLQTRSSHLTDVSCDWCNLNVMWRWPHNDLLSPWPCALYRH